MMANDTGRYDTGIYALLSQKMYVCMYYDVVIASGVAGDQ